MRLPCLMCYREGYATRPDIQARARHFTIGERIHSGLPPGASDELRFGLFEGALDRFRQIADHESDEGTREQCHA